MSGEMDLASAGAGFIGSVVGGTMQIGQSIAEAREAKKLQSKLVRPDYKIQQPILDNQALAESLGSQGLSDQALETYRASADRNLNSSINAILRGGGDVNNISDLYDTAGQSDQHIALLEEEVRQKNMQNLMKQNETMAGEQEKKWIINEYGPYQDTKQLIAGLKNQSNQNKWGGINTIIGGVNNAASSLLGSGNNNNKTVDPGANSTYTSSVSIPSNYGNVTTPAPATSSLETNFYLNMLKRRSFAQ